jgi:hypothetical protein
VEEREVVEKASKEAIDKVTEEERRNKGVEMRNDNAQPMDTDIQEVSTVDTC